ncbi:hypothetical protein L195_g031293 [Trifolium pratense]|uniref:DUF868 family protein n=2 Tax=Trifolium pratense TaxID=57577 RepID=A0A2K3L9Z7_TRIPR|nr:hypothetical protein L195_g031293 [Trifolium pratense]CAJ2652410.1 unnamed protein product [Trifolium pratense]
MAFRAFRSQSVSTQGSHNLAEKTTEEPVPSKVAQSTVTCFYQTNVAGFWRNVSILWCKNLMNHSLHITIDSVGGESQFSCKIDVKPWNFWSRKGYKSFEVEGSQVEVYWDLRCPKFTGSPEPVSDYYVALVSDDEVVLLLGDYKKKAYKRTKSRPALVDARLLVKKENIFAKKIFTTKAKLDEMRKENEIVIDSLTGSNTNDPEMWITIDGLVLLHVKNLQWKFRGNQTVMVDKQPVQVFWDVHDWLFSSSSSSSGPGLFIFKPGPAEAESEKEDGAVEGSESDDGSVANSSSLNSSTFEFCLVLYAYKIE